MSDNVTVDNGTLTDYTAATDDVGGVQFQKVKLDVGGDGASTPVEGSMPVSGNVAHDAADSGNPVKIGGKANSSEPASVAEGDRVNAWFTPQGTQVVAVAHDTGDGTYLAPISPDGTSAPLYVKLSPGTNSVGNVNVNTVPAPLSTTGNGTSDFALRVTVASDTTGVLSVDDNGNSLTVDVGTALPAGTNAIGKLAANSGVDIGDVDVTSLPALPAGTNNIGDVDVLTMPKSGTATLSNVSSSASSVTLLSSNAARLGATIHNDSTQILYVKFGTTASATSYTVKMVADAYFELPFSYTGRIDGIWASANGNARVTELT